MKDDSRVLKYLQGDRVIVGVVGDAANKIKIDPLIARLVVLVLLILFPKWISVVYLVGFIIGYSLLLHKNKTGRDTTHTKGNADITESEIYKEYKEQYSDKDMYYLLGGQGTYQEPNDKSHTNTNNTLTGNQKDIGEEA